MTPRHPFEPSGRARRGFPLASPASSAATGSSAGLDTELVEKLGRNDLCPCGSGRRFPSLLPENRPFRRSAGRLLRPGLIRTDAARFARGGSAAALANTRFCRQQGQPGSPGAGTLVRSCMPHGVRHPGGETDRQSPCRGRAARILGQDDPDAAGVLDRDSGPEMGTSPGSSNGPEPGRRPCPGTPWRGPPTRPRSPGRRRSTAAPERPSSISASR